MFIEVKNYKARITRDLARACFCALLLLCCFAAGCATPIGVVRGTTQQTYYALTANVLSAGEPSSWSKQVLHRSNLTEQYADDPVAALAALHKRLKEDITRTVCSPSRSCASSTPNSQASANTTWRRRPTPTPLCSPSVKI